MNNTLISRDLLRGKLVRLAAGEPQALAEAFSRWNLDSEYFRQLDSDAPFLWSLKKYQAWEEKDLEETGQQQGVFFTIRTIENDLLIGFTALFSKAWQHGDAWVAIGIGEKDYRGRGYGTDAMRLVLRFAFDELNLHRVTLGVFGYNRRAIRSYEKAGFILEGTQRDMLNRDGRRWDMHFMGVLRADWQGE